MRGASSDVYFVADDAERVQITGLPAALSNAFLPSSSPLSCHINGDVTRNSCKKRVAVLISGSGVQCCPLLSLC